MQQSDLMIGKKQFKRQGHTYVMGILNVTPDSFSDGGSYPELSDALYRVEQMMNDPQVLFIALCKADSRI